MKAIVATEKNWGIGKDGALLMHLPGDLRFFKEQTLGKVLIMGRKTLESLPGARPLPGRTTIVLTSNKAYTPKHLGADGKPLNPDKECGKLVIVNNMEELMTQLMMLEYTTGIDAEEDVYVAGGQSIYEMFMPYTAEFIVTRIDKEIGADVYFPNLDKYVADGQLKLTWESEVQTDEKTGTKYRFVRYER